VDDLITGLSWTYKNGLIEIRLVKDRVELGVLQCSKEYVFQVVEGLIGLFRTLSEHHQNIKQYSKLNAPFTRATIPLSSFRLAENPSPQLTTIVLDIGELELGFSIPTAELTDLGQALLAAGAAASSKPN
jgi:hypothetical protein